MSFSLCGKAEGINHIVTWQALYIFRRTSGGSCLLVLVWRRSAEKGALRELLLGRQSGGAAVEKAL